MPPDRKALDCAIIGDNFMRPERFAEAISARCNAAVSLRHMTLPFPDAPMIHGYAKPGHAGAGLEELHEYQGDPGQITEFVGSAAILVTHLAPVSASMLERMPALRLIAVARGGPVNIDMKTARARHIQVVNAPGRNAAAVAEFTIGAILTQTRLICAGHDALRGGLWRGDLYRADRTGRELSELTIGIIGYGRIGSRVARLLQAFGCRILVHDPYADAGADGLEAAALNKLLDESDVVTLHPRVTSETTGMMNAAAIGAMRPGAILINTARGPLVDYEALTSSLESGHLGGAALDTFEIEPVPAGLRLLTLPNVTLTPHIAGASVRTITIAASAAAEEVRRFIAGEAALNPC